MKRPNGETCDRTHIPASARSLYVGVSLSLLDLKLEVPPIREGKGPGTR